ncbi:polyprenyl synthetase family protein [Gordonia desulfuricans]|uniref:Polyprenyl synthetase family protein n=1 Tax=Gordonia desulfuricans TaxID=89051 RepID=A0A7K3LT49_9ACTN|nr:MULTISPECIES: polyprenyl synthetase family protein [Gordonia]EMP11369.2 geranylgeranyl pyrophosphate synthase [Gordonia sp. NB41Y]NDK91402.1 polyprenyl synthetase family protein [Gordonia desulfuricans]WLP92090.1 polyprenyl synthetase family protein [Gordonia sp. NB41Y]
MKSTFTGVDLVTDEFAETVRSSLARVEDLLLTELASGDDVMTEAATHLAKAGGKRFRPMFAILAAQFGPQAGSDDVITSATVVEMIHLATLYHDDVMDEAPMRRGAQSANARWTNSIAILAGDFLFARASRLVSTLGPEAVRIIAETFAELVTGQMRETVGAGEGVDPIDHYLKVVWEKTGSLIAAAARFGAMASGASATDTDRLSRIGDLVGTAFQVSDDIIDISSATGDSGKTPGTDLREGVHTLPVLYAVREQGADADRLRALLLTDSGAPRPLTDDDEVAEALTLLNASPGMAAAHAKMDELAAQARAELAQLPDIPANQAMRSLVTYTVDRIG